MIMNNEKELSFLKLLNKHDLINQLQAILELFKLDSYKKVSIISFFSNYFNLINAGIKISIVDNYLCLHIESKKNIKIINGIFDDFEYIEKNNFILNKYKIILSNNFKLNKKVVDEINKISLTRDSLLKINHKLEKQAYYDNLTNVFNRNKFNELLEREIDRAKRYKMNLSFAIFDIDHFKHVNDNFGHLVGDKVLVEFSSLIASNIRKSDIFARWGGEEFVLLMPKTNGLDAKKVAEKIRNIIANNIFEVVKTITCSIGISEYTDNIAISKLITDSDDALYFAKENGRNQTVLSREIEK